MSAFLPLAAKKRTSTDVGKVPTMDVSFVCNRFCLSTSRFSSLSRPIASSCKSVGTANIYGRSYLMSERKRRNAMRSVIADELHEFYRSLIAQFTVGTDDFLRRAELSSMTCPSCGAQMVPSRSIATSDPGEPQHVFACRRCGLSYLTQDFIPVCGRSGMRPAWLGENGVM
jgi:hypothetical protein